MKRLKIVGQIVVGNVDFMGFRNCRLFAFFYIGTNVAYRTQSVVIEKTVVADSTVLVCKSRIMG